MVVCSGQNLYSVLYEFKVSYSLCALNMNYILSEDYTPEFFEAIVDQLKATQIADYYIKSIFIK